MKILHYINETRLKINSSVDFPFSNANVLLFINFLYCNKVEIKKFDNFQKLEYNLFNNKVISEKEYRDSSLEFCGKLGFLRCQVGSRFLNDCYIFNHYNWMLKNEELKPIDSPFYSVILILERGGYIWKYKGNYQIGEKTIQVPFCFENELLFEIPSFESEFLSIIDLNVFDSNIPKKEEVYTIYNNWINSKK